ncbi:MAG: diadenylate cyclase CdaA [Oscillospiraceae bacterium]|nr:diadenylate cyclase CdaA [Oscillospiraceae bacterium]MBR4656741.1 diadenylate cyclase CdaA [Oscillospiraceae bacterium]
MKEIQEFFSNLKSTFPSFDVTDAIDILVVAGLIYYVIKLIWNTSARRIAWAIVILLLATLLTEVLNLHTVNYLLDRVLQLGFVALVIVFQPELRRLLERVGSKASDVKNLFSLSNTNNQSEAPEAIEEVVSACETMSAERIGALIVFERSNSLEQIAATGTRVDAAVSEELIRNIFFPKASLHDGAMIIQNSRILAAGCVLPLSENRSLSTDLGTRHRAGVGMSETSDAVIVIVSEETGAISVAIGGMLKRHLAKQTLQKLLTQELIGENKARPNVLNIIKNRRKGGDDNVSGR